ncbi:MAG: DUF2917 domain-containing protein [Pseudomonadota bacterium]
MELQTRHPTQQSLQQSLQQSTRAGVTNLPGTWKLAPGRAITLQPREEGTFKVAHGEVWVTRDGPHHGAGNQSGDYFVAAGQTLRVRAGERLVLESSNWTQRAPSYFSWEPLPVRARQPAHRISAVTQPLADLRLAITFGGRALARLAAGVAGLAWGTVFAPA